jgi:hypothetical protein
MLVLDIRQFSVVETVKLVAWIFASISLFSLTFAAQYGTHLHYT